MPLPGHAGPRGTYLHRRLRITKLFCEDIVDVDTITVFHFHFPEVMNGTRPRAELDQHVRGGLGNEDMSTVAAVHYSLRKIDSPTKEVEVGVNVGYTINRSGMDSHAQPE